MRAGFNLHQVRFTDPAAIDETAIEASLRDGARVIVQFSKPCFGRQMLARLNELCEKYGPEFEVRFFGFYGESFNCESVLMLPNVKSLSVDCLIRAHNIPALADLQQLHTLLLGIYEMKEPDILNAANFRKLRRLIIGETRWKPLDLKYLCDFQSLELLVIGGHTKNIDSVGNLKNLEYLGLSSIKRVALNFVNDLPRLRSLGIILGGRENINEIKGNGIEELEIIWVRGFNDLPDIGRFEKLTTLHIEDQIKLERLDFESEMPALTEVKIFNCKNLASVTGLQNLPRLKQIRLAMTKIDFSEFVKQRIPATLETLAFYTGKKGLNDRIHAEIRKLGYREI